MSKYLNLSGLEYYDSKIKDYIDEQLEIKVDDTNTSHNHNVGAGLVCDNTTATTTGTVTYKAKLKSETASTLDSSSMSATANRQYAVGIDKSGYLSVNVPWSNSDTKVKQNLESTANAEFPILMAPSGQSSTSTDGVYFDNNITVNPSTNTITANLSGTAANATNAITATKLGNNNVGTNTQPVYLNSGIATACTYTLGTSVPSNAKFTDTTYGLATTSSNGLMGSEQVTALQTIQSDLDTLEDGLESGSVVVKYSDELTGRVVPTEEEISFRPTGDISIGDGDASIHRIKGKSVVWNQFCKPIDTTVGGWDEENMSASLPESGVARFEIRNISTGNYVQLNFNKYHTVGHKYFISVEARQNVSSYNFQLRAYGYSNSLGTALTSEWKTYSHIVEAKENQYHIFRLIQLGEDQSLKAVGDYVEVRKNFYIDLTLMFGEGNEPTTVEEFEKRRPLCVSSAFNEGELVSFNADSLKSVGFNAWDEEWEAGILNFGNAEAAGDRIRSKNYIRVLAGVPYKLNKGNAVFMCYDENYNFIEYTGQTGSNVWRGGLDINATNVPKSIFTFPQGTVYAKFYLATTYNHDICINLAHTGYRNGEYQPYMEDTLDLSYIKQIKDKEGNQLFPNGLLSAGEAYDEITPTKAIKRIGVVDMGTLGWNIVQLDGRHVFYVPLPTGVYRADYINSVTSKYIHKQYSYPDLLEKEACIYFYENTRIAIRDDSYTDVASFKVAMRGVMLYYELAEPVEVELTDGEDMIYDAWDFGTERIEGDIPSTPMYADIAYSKFNATDRIRENSEKIKANKIEINELNAKVDGINNIIEETSSKASSAYTIANETLPNNLTSGTLKVAKAVNADTLGSTSVGSNAKPIYLDSSGKAIESTYNLLAMLSQIDSKAGTALADSSTAGLMSADDKKKLDGIAVSANKYELPVASGSILGGVRFGNNGDITIDSSGYVRINYNSLPTASTSSFGVVKIGSNISYSSSIISLTKENVTNALGYTPPTTNTTYNTVTSSVAGLVPAMGTTTTATIATQADEWVLTTTKGSTPTWRKLPANAFKNDNTTYSFSNAGATLSWGTTTTIATVGGTNITVKMPSNPNTNTTYSAGSGIILNGTTFSLTSGVVSAGSAGPTGNITGNDGSTVYIPQITVDTYGRVTALTNRTYTAKNTTYSTATTSTNGLMSSTDKTNLNDAIKSLSVSGRVITYTKVDGDTGTITTQDTNTTYSNATASSNGLMSSAMYSKVNTNSSNIATNTSAISLLNNWKDSILSTTLSSSVPTSPVALSGIGVMRIQVVSSLPSDAFDHPNVLYIIKE